MTLHYTCVVCSHRQEASKEQPASTKSDRQDRSDSNAPPRPDFGCCLLHQKLQMLNMCIHSAHQHGSVPHVGAPLQQVSTMGLFTPLKTADDLLA